MSKTAFHLKTDNQDTIEYLRSKKNISKYLEELVEKERIGALVDRIDDESAKELLKIYKQKQIENIELRNENLEYKNKIDKVKADYAETFQKPPSSAAVEAIGKRFESAKPTTSTQISKATTMRFIHTCKKNDLGQWVIICTLCRSDFIDTNQEKALEEFRTHLQKDHAPELLT